MSSKPLSAIIVTYNSASDIEACLRALLSRRSDLLDEIVVVDNASEDSTCAIVARYDAVRLIQHASNEGFAVAVNTGIASTTGDYVLVLNSDVVMTPGAIGSLVKSLREHGKYAAVGCQMIHPDGRTQVSARRFPTVSSFVGRVLLTNHVARWLGISHEFGEWTDFTQDDHGITQVDWVLGGCMLIRRSAYNAIGPLDEKYFLYYEDIDWCYRARLDHWKIGFSSNTQVIHAHRRGSSNLTLTNPLMRVHLASASRFFVKFAAHRGLRAVF